METKKVYVTTFERGSSQGTVIPVKVMDLEIHSETMPLVCYVGCFSGEIIRNQTVYFVELFGRQYIVRLFNERSYQKVDLQITVPWNVAEQIKNTCPHCGKLV
jgi:hypothetical protein